MSTQSSSTHKPRVAIYFCTKCKWNLRAAWYLQELLQTFGDKLGEAALVPAASGMFKVEVVAEGAASVTVWERTVNGGFPDSKILKQKVRNVLWPEEQLGHVDGANKNDGVLVCTDCTDCTEQ
jgi:selenoprotein W-related protein